MVKEPGADIGVYCVHLKSNRSDNRERASQNMIKRENATRQLLDHISTVLPQKMPEVKTIIIGGDFNTNADQTMFAQESTLMLLARAGFDSLFKNVPLNQRITHQASGPYPAATFDYVFIKSGVLSNPRIEETGGSDHFSVTCDIELAPPTNNSVGIRVGQSRPTPRKSQRVDVEIGKPLQLRQFGGPNLELSILSTDIGNLTLQSID